MVETASLIAGALLVGLQAAWLGLGAYLNLRHPSANGELVAEVMTMRRVRQYPEIFGTLGAKRIESPRWHRLVFRLVVAVELLVAAALLAATLLLVLAACGAFEPEAARALAILAVTAFTAIWAAFLIGGEWFAYWAGSEGLQQTHFFMTLWGVATLAVLV